MKKNYFKKQYGFIALISTLILTIVLTMVIMIAGTSSFFARFDSEGIENRKISKELSESCMNLALLKISNNYNYLGNESIIVTKDKNCFISTIQYLIIDSNTPITSKKKAKIETTAQFPIQNGSWSKSVVTADIENPQISTSPANKLIIIDTWL